jgi:hypothetical protein
MERYDAQPGGRAFMNGFAGFRSCPHRGSDGGLAWLGQPAHRGGDRDSQGVDPPLGKREVGAEGGPPHGALHHDDSQRLGGGLYLEDRELTPVDSMAQGTLNR